MLQVGNLAGHEEVTAGYTEREYPEVVSFFNVFADDEGHWRRRNATYHRLINRIMRSMVPPGHSVLEIGSGGGDLLAALEPEEGIGVDLSPTMVELARKR